MLCKQKYNSVHFWSAGGLEQKVMYRCSTASMYLILPARRDSCQDVHQHVCTPEGESLLSHPKFWCQNLPQLVQFSSAPAFPLKCPIYTSWAGDTGSVGVLEVLGLSYRLCVKSLLLWMLMGVEAQSTGIRELFLLWEHFLRCVFHFLAFQLEVFPGTANREGESC